MFKDLSCQEAVECVKNIVPIFVLISIVIACFAAIGLILLGHLDTFQKNLDTFVGILLIVAGLQNGDIKQ